jgi:hypothetical protein
LELAMSIVPDEEVAEKARAVMVDILSTSF